MGKVLFIIFSVLSVLSLGVVSAYLFFENTKLNEEYDSATKQIVILQSKLDSVGTFVDVYTVKTSVKMGQEIKADDLILFSIPTSSLPKNLVTNPASIIGNYYRIGFDTGVPLTTDLIIIDEYVGSIYERDIFLDSVPVNLKVGDYVDIRIVLPGGEEFVVFSHRRVNERVGNSLKMKFDEADLWLYTSMMTDKAVYGSFGIKLYATKYVDPGAHENTMAYYPVRREVMDIVNINTNMTSEQKSRLWNDDLRKSIEAKLEFYRDPLNKDTGPITNGVNSEQSRYTQMENELKMRKENTAELDSVNELQNPYEESLGTLGDISNHINENIGVVSDNSNSSDDAESTNESIDMGGPSDVFGNQSVISPQEYQDSLGDNLYDDESPIN